LRKSAAIATSNGRFRAPILAAAEARLPRRLVEVEYMQPSSSIDPGITLSVRRFRGNVLVMVCRQPWQLTKGRELVRLGQSDPGLDQV
jgi:hypothetical protein